MDKPFSDPSPVFANEASGYHLSLAKMDSAPSSSVVGLHGINTGGLNIHHHFIANSEASLLKIHNHHEPIIASAPRKSFVSRIPPLGRSGSSEVKHSCESKMNALFEKYRDLEIAASESAGAAGEVGSSNNNSKEELILAYGTEALCKDLELKPDDFRILVLAWKCNAEQMCRFTRQQFVQGCRSLKADSIRSLQIRLPEAVAEIMSHPELFKSLYRFTFRFGQASSSPQQSAAVITSSVLPYPRHLPIDMALILWQLVFSQRQPPILEKWLNFHEALRPVSGVTGDTWDMFLPFALSVDSDLSGYDDSEAWPSLFDDFVEFENDQANQNYAVSKPYNKSPNGSDDLRSPLIEKPQGEDWIVYILCNSALIKKETTTT